MRKNKIHHIVLAALLTIIGIAPVQARDASTDQQSFARKLAVDEPKILDATWMNAHSLYVGVRADGTLRDGFAAYVCSDAKSVGARTVTVIDIVHLKRTGKFKKIGSAVCR